MSDNLVDKTVSEMQVHIGEWAAATFPEHTDLSIAAHLLSEAAGLYVAAGGNSVDASMIAFTAKKKPHWSIPQEAADVAILLLTLADHVGFPLAVSIASKMEINRTRKWGLPNAFGFAEHVPEEEDSDVPGS